MKRICMMLLCLLLVSGTVGTASAEGFYTPLNVEVPVGGTGTFFLKEEGAADDVFVCSGEITESGVMVLSFDEPGQYRYELFSTDEQNSMRYNVIIEVMTTEDDQLEAWVTITEVGQDRKIPVAYYPPAPIDPPIRKYVTGDNPPKTETFYVIFRGVSTTAAELDGRPPMPAGAEGQSKRLAIVGASTVEAGEIILPRAGQYVYEFVEETGSAAGYSYDKSVIRAVYDVTEGPTCLEVVETFYKDGQKIEAAGVNFVNRYTTPSTGGKNPKTGDSEDLMLWLGLMGMSFAAAGVAAAITVRKSRRDMENE